MLVKDKASSYISFIETSRSPKIIRGEGQPKRERENEIETDAID